MAIMHAEIGRVHACILACMRLRADVEHRMARRGEGLRPKGVPVPSRVAAWWACVRGARAEELAEHQLVGRLRPVAKGRHCLLYTSPSPRD